MAEASRAEQETAMTLERATGRVERLRDEAGERGDADTMRALNALLAPGRLCHGRDAAFWHESYALVRDAVIEHLDEHVADDDTAEEAILIRALESAGRALKAAGQLSSPSQRILSVTQIEEARMRWLEAGQLRELAKMTRSVKQADAWNTMADIEDRKARSLLLGESGG